MISIEWNPYDDDSHLNKGMTFILNDAGDAWELSSGSMWGLQDSNFFEEVFDYLIDNKIFCHTDLERYVDSVYKKYPELHGGDK